jgi:hypothetical protein
MAQHESSQNMDDISFIPSSQPEENNNNNKRQRNNNNPNNPINPLTNMDSIFSDINLSQHSDQKENIMNYNNKKISMNSFTNISRKTLKSALDAKILRLRLNGTFVNSHHAIPMFSQRLYAYDELNSKYNEEVAKLSQKFTNDLQSIQLRFTMEQEKKHTEIQNTYFNTIMKEGNSEERNEAQSIVNKLTHEYQDKFKSVYNKLLRFTQQSKQRPPQSFIGTNVKRSDNKRLSYSNDNSSRKSFLNTSRNTSRRSSFNSSKNTSPYSSDNEQNFRPNNRQPRHNPYKQNKHRYVHFDNNHFNYNNNNPNNPIINFQHDTNFPNNNSTHQNSSSSSSSTSLSTFINPIPNQLNQPNNNQQQQWSPQPQRQRYQKNDRQFNSTYDRGPNQN